MGKDLRSVGYRYMADFGAVTLAASGSTYTCALIYDFNITEWQTIDFSQQWCNFATFISPAAITGAAAGATLELQHRSVAGTVVDQVNLAFVAGQNATAFVPIDLTGLGTNITAPTGNPLSAGWLLTLGDSLWAGWVQGATGLALPAGACVQFEIGAQGA